MRLSTSMEALIAVMARSGRAANLPPHIWAPAGGEAGFLGSDMASDTQQTDKAPRPPYGLWAAFALFIGAAGLLVYSFVAEPGAPGSGPMMAYAKGALEKLTVLEEPPPQPDTALTDAAGAETNLAALHGKVVLVNLWATWCAPCREEMPTLASLHQRFEHRGFMVAPVSVDQPEAQADAKDALAAMSGGALPFFAAPGMSFATSLGVRGLPVSILYDREGRELARLVGSADWASPEAASLIEAALGA
jgi:thiol-disulfide isomerase/thioredoxin